MIFEKENRTVVDTAEESANSKWNSVCSGYYDDKYIVYMTGVRSETLPHQKIGYYLRHTLIHDATKKFYSIYGSESQVVIIGCGYDTLFWICQDENIRFKKWFELDKEELIKKKSKIISNNEILQKSVNETYILKDIDFDEIKSFSTEFESIGFDKNLPTLFIDEFSMIYFEIETTTNFLNEIGKLKNSCIVSYGMVLLDDEFGTFVNEGFEEMGIPLKSYALTATEEDYIQLFLNSGFECSKAMNCTSMLKNYFDEKEITRIIHLEHIDDLKDMLYSMKHYCGTLGGNEEFVSIIPI